MSSVGGEFDVGMTFVLTFVLGTSSQLPNGPCTASVCRVSKGRKDSTIKIACNYYRNCQRLPSLCT